MSVYPSTIRPQRSQKYPHPTNDDIDQTGRSGSRAVGARHLQTSCTEPEPHSDGQPGARRGYRLEHCAAGRVGLDYRHETSSCGRWFDATLRRATQRPRHRHLRPTPHAPVPCRTDATILPSPPNRYRRNHRLPGLRGGLAPNHRWQSLSLARLSERRPLYLIQHHDADNFTVIPGPTTELQHRLANHIAIFTERRRG